MFGCGGGRGAIFVQLRIYPCHRPPPEFLPWDVKMTLKTVTIYFHPTSAKSVLSKTSHRDGKWSGLVRSTSGSMQLHLMCKNATCLKRFAAMFRHVLQHAPTEDRDKQTMRLNDLSSNKLKVYPQDVEFIYKKLDAALQMLIGPYPGVSIACIK